MNSPTPRKNIRWATDIGGTFTDIVLSIDGEMHARKVLTTPAQPERAVIDGSLQMMRDMGIAPEMVDIFVHGTTLATNAILERRGARCALIGTEGFRDILSIGDEGRFDQYDIFIEKVAPLIAPELCFTLPERMSAAGEVLRPLDETAVHALMERIDALGIRSVAICFIHGYANAAHERRVAQIIAEHHPDWFVSLSSEVCPEVREYERCSTTAANAYVKPIMAGYLQRLEQELVQQGFRCPTYLMTSGGGLTTLRSAMEFPIRLVESGPAGGAILAAHVARLCERQNVLAFDMGGTTAKVSFIDDFEPHTSRSFEVDRASGFRKGSGLPLRIPVIDMVEISAGGGSLCDIGMFDNITVGPESASSVPGPACYPNGGTRPTVTDSNLVLGRLDAHNFAGGTIALDTAAAAAAIARTLGERLDCAAHIAALGVSQRVEENMANAARVHASECGKDLAKFSMVAFGGAAPVHAVAVARKLGIRQIILPPNAGVGSAVGFLLAPMKYELVRSHCMPVAGFDHARAQALLQAMEDEGRAVVTAGQDANAAEHRVVRRAYMRYMGQGHEVLVELPTAALDAQAEVQLRQWFETQYKALYGRVIPDAQIEVVTWTVSLIGATAEVKPLAATGARQAATRAGTRQLLADGGGEFEHVPVFWRPDLAVGAHFAGPALLDDESTTLLLPAGYTAQVVAERYVIIDETEITA